ncbi:MAG: CotH kinase family protein [Prolixibacteraceae bacterium]
MKIFTFTFFNLLLLNSLAQTIFPLHSNWNYQKGNEAPSGGDDWTQLNFDDSKWQTSQAPFRYGDGEGGTILDDMQGNYNSVYLRTEFEYDLEDTLESITVLVNYDDAFQLWLNGEVVLTVNYPNNATFNTFANGNHESGELETFRLDPEVHALKLGSNQLAVHGLNVSNTSSDFYFDMQLAVKIHVTPVYLPLAEPAAIEVQSGFYDEPFTAIITAQNSGDTVVYTVDGSDPRISSTTIQAVTPCAVLIDPDNTARKHNTPVFLLQACKYQYNHALSHPVTASYIFLDKVVNQKHPGGDWPLASQQINGQIFDFDMDPEIVNSSAYKDEIRPALLDIPSISIVSDLSNLFDQQTGIWVNALEHGDEWERPASFQIIDPQGNGTSEMNCGIRIRGGYSRNDGNPKHALRVFFRDEYGESKLKFPLFGDEGTDEFDKIDFRTSQNYSWSFNGGDGKYNIMNREIFSRDIQGQMGGLYTRSRYYHLYLNGMYWGIYQSQERSEARFAEDYLGRDKDDYDVIKVRGEQRELEATDGTTDVWEEVFKLTQKGFQNNVDYFKLLGLDAQGEVDPAGMCYVDVANLIDYVMVIFYTGNYDAPTNIWSNNKGVNNFYTIKNRNRTRSGFVFLQHDAEHSLLYDAVNVGSGISQNRVNLGFLNDNMKMTVSDFANFHPQYLHHKLMENSEYRQLFIDRVYLWFFKEKVLQKENSQEVFWSRAVQIEKAIVAESARWGDSKVSSPRTKKDDWEVAINQVMYKYFEERPAIVMDQIKEVGWFTSFSTPEFYRGALKIEEYHLNPVADEIISIKNPDNKGDIYYTYDGSDPRALGGAVSKNAKTASGDVEIKFRESAMIKARIKNGNEWSAINELRLLKNDDLSTLKISEIHYHPLETALIGSKEMEFIEFKNVGNSALNLSGLSISGGISYKFEEGVVIPAGQFIVLASNAFEFLERYGVKPTGEFSGHLSNSSDTLIVTGDSKELYNIIYSQEAPWPAEADGEGNSLVYNEEEEGLEASSAYYWRSSNRLGGTPFADDFKTAIDALNSDGTLSANFSFYPNPATTHLNINYTISKAGPVTLKLFNTWGQNMATFEDNVWHEKGKYTTFVHLENYSLSRGVYILQFSNNGLINKQKLTLK